MAKKNVKLSNARHRFLESKNVQKAFMANSAGDSKWKRYNYNSVYHRSVIWAQEHAGRVLTSEERKCVFEAAKHSDGRAVMYYPSK